MRGGEPIIGKDLSALVLAIHVQNGVSTTGQSRVSRDKAFALGRIVSDPPLRVHACIWAAVDGRRASRTVGLFRPARDALKRHIGTSGCGNGRDQSGRLRNAVFGRAAFKTVRGGYDHSNAAHYLQARTSGLRRAQ
jgi:hypothetical protein